MENWQEILILHTRVSCDFVSDPPCDPCPCRNVWEHKHIAFQEKFGGFQSQTSFCWYLLVLYQHDITPNTLYTKFLLVKYGEIPFNPCLNHIRSYLFDALESLFSPFSSLFLFFFSLNLTGFGRTLPKAPGIAWLQAWAGAFGWPHRDFRHGSRGRAWAAWASGDEVGME